MAEAIRRDLPIYQTEEPLPKCQKKEEDLGLQGRVVADFDYDIKSIATKVEGFINATGDTAFISGLGLDASAKIFQGGATTSDEIERAKASKTHTARGVHIMKAIRGLLTLISGGTSTFQAGFSLAAISNASNVVTRGLATLKAISGPVGGILLSATVIPRCIELNKMNLIRNTIKYNGLKGLNELFLKNPGAIELALPDVYKKLKLDVKFTDKDLEEIAKGLDESIKMTSIRIVVGAITLLLTILGAVLTSGAAPMIILVAGLVISLVSGGLDLKAVIDMLKKAVKLTEKDKVIQVITITLAAVSAVVATIFAPTIGLKIAALAVGGFMTLIPVASLIGLSIKEELLKQKRKDQKTLEDKLIDQRARNLSMRLDLMDV